MNGLLLLTPVFLARLQIYMIVSRAVVVWNGANMLSCRNTTATERHVLEVLACTENNEVLLLPHATFTKLPQ